MDERTAEPEARVSAYSYYVVAILGVVYLFSFLDRQIMSILAEPVKRDLGLTDTQLGLLSGFMFAIFYVTCGIPLAWLADRTNRVRIVAACCALWSVFSMSCGLASNFFQLALSRIGVAVGEAGGSPPSYSVIADYFPAHRRGSALALFSLGGPLGTAFGAALGGWVAAEFGWRMAFVVTAAPGILVSLVLLLTVREPVRGRFDPPQLQTAATAVQPLWTTFGRYRRNPILVRTTVSSALSAFVGYALLAWSPALLMRTKGMSMSEIAAFYSIVVGLSVALGTLASGWLVDRLGRKDQRAYALVPGAAFLTALPFFVAMVLTPDWRPALGLLIVPMAMYAMWVAPALALVQNTVGANERGATSAILLCIAGIVGMGCGPVFVGMVSDMALHIRDLTPLQVGMAALTPFFLLAAIAHYAASRALMAAPARPA